MGEGENLPSISVLKFIQPQSLLYDLQYFLFIATPPLRCLLVSSSNPSTKGLVKTISMLVSGILFPKYLIKDCYQTLIIVSGMVLLSVQQAAILCNLV